MDYKTKSVLTVTVLALFMIVTAVFINNLDGSITGATVKTMCNCDKDKDCDDGDACTEDICLYADNCEAALCVNKEIENCK
ncbi:hypothetical protein GOV06_01235 [Candidatus Woesearchaeota archaeon]|nr:hypothetical protein [Candidatus Woesearchaeota archaeon]